MNPHQPDPVLAEYFEECEELCAKISSALQALEKGSLEVELVQSLCREVHTLKGTSQLFGYLDIGELAHAFEERIDPLRKKLTPIEPTSYDLLYRTVGIVESMLRAHRLQEPEDFTARVKALLTEFLTAPKAATSDSPAPVVHPTVPAAAVPAAATIAPMPIAPAAAMIAPAPVQAPAPATESAETSTIRVSVSLLDRLMTLMGEMVLVRNQVLQYANKTDELDFLKLSQRLDVVTSEIQGEVMKTRMQPIGNVLTKFQRVVRDLSKELTKKIELSLTGVETELDKTLLEAVKDPLMHIVRNSCDHGIELPEERRLAGKPEHGTIQVRAYHEGGQVIVEVQDDGRGLHREKLLKKAIEKGLLTPEKAAALSDRETFGLIFAAGFSTAAQVTNVSGRGVGMDVVKNNIEGIGGNVEVTSQPGHGTTTRLNIPLTLAIVPAMIVQTLGEKFAIPQAKLLQLIRVDPATGSSTIEWLHGKPIFRLRGELLPLLSLDEILGRPTRPIEPDAIVQFAVLNAEGRTFGLIVDEVLDTAEVVVKPLASFLKSLTVYSGATVLGDGSIALILDAVGIARKHGLLLDVGATRVSRQAERDIREAQEFLLLKVSSPTKHGIPLNLVHRLEEFPTDRIEWSGEQRIIRYRGSALPLLSLDQVLKYPTPDEAQKETISVVVLQSGGRLVGVEVSEILDVLSTFEPLDDQVIDRFGLLGNLVTPDEMIVVVDVFRVLDEFQKKLRGGAAAHRHSLQGKRILYAEDTVFFRRQVTAILEREGAILVQAFDGQEALEIFRRGGAAPFDLVLSDIEMPRLGGLALARALRASPGGADIPLVALTTRFNPESVAKGLAAGFDAYLEKLKQDSLIQELQTALLKSKVRHQEAS